MSHLGHAIGGWPGDRKNCGLYDTLDIRWTGPVAQSMMGFDTSNCADVLNNNLANIKTAK